MPKSDRKVIVEFRNRHSAPLVGLINPEFANNELARHKQAGLVSKDVSLGYIKTPLLVAKPAYAQVNAGFVAGRFGLVGRWIAPCPEHNDPVNPCAGAEWVDFKTPVFMCCSCFNQNIGYQWRPLILPDKHFRVQIERELLDRPWTNLHNWLPDESVDDLKTQNIKLGVGPDLTKSEDK